MSVCDQCEANIQQKVPPTLCPRSYCQAIQRELARYCMDHHDLLGQPIPQIGPDGQRCWCCCGAVCGTLVATGPGVYQYLDSLRRGDEVLVAGADLAAWTPAPVVAMAVLGAGSGASFAVELQIDFSGGEHRTVVLNSEALVMTAGGKLKPAGRLSLDEALRAADGRVAKVRLSTLTDKAAALPYLGPLDPREPLSGHLLDVAGLVCGDLAVVTAAYAGTLPKGMLAAVPERPAPPFDSKAS